MLIKILKIHLTRAHIQSIDGFWSVLKRKIRKRGIHHGDLEIVFEKIQEDFYKKNYSDYVFETIIKDINFYSNQM